MRAGQFLLGGGGVEGEGEGRGRRREQGYWGRDGPDIVCTYE
jgi:hypothetical protein